MKTFRKEYPDGSWVKVVACGYDKYKVSCSWAMLSNEFTEEGLITFLENQAVVAEQRAASVKRQSELLTRFGFQRITECAK